MNLQTAILIESTTRDVTEFPTADDYKDSIVELWADAVHLTDAEIDQIYEIFMRLKNGVYSDFLSFAFPIS